MATLPFEMGLTNISFKPCHHIGREKDDSDDSIMQKNKGARIFRNEMERYFIF